MTLLNKLLALENIKLFFLNVSATFVIFLMNCVYIIFVTIANSFFVLWSSALSKAIFQIRFISKTQISSSIVLKNVVEKKLSWILEPKGKNDCHFSQFQIQGHLFYLASETPGTLKLLEISHQRRRTVYRSELRKGQGKKGDFAVDTRQRGWRWELEGFRIRRMGWLERRWTQRIAITNWQPWLMAVAKGMPGPETGGKEREYGFIG